MRKSKILAWKSLFLRRKGKIRARQSSGSLRSEASQGSSTASRRATRVLDKLPRGFVFNYGELALPGFEVQSVLPLFRSRAFLRGRERKASWRNWLQQTTPGRFSTGTTIVSLRSSITYDAAKSSRQQEQIERDTTEACCPCDASAEQASQPGLAVEHTIIPTFDVQKEKDAQFMRAIGDLGSRAQKLFPVSPVACR